MEKYKMVWGDVLRMSTPDWRIPPNTFKEVEFSPLKKKYEEKSNNPKMLREALIWAFRTATHKFTVKKWIFDVIGGIPQEMQVFPQKRTRYAIAFIKIEEQEEIIKETEEEESSPEEDEEDIKEKEYSIWQQ